MKTLLFIFAGTGKTASFDKIFGGQSSYERVLLWANELKDVETVCVVCTDKESALAKEQQSVSSKKIEFVTENSWNAQSLIKTMTESLAAKNAQTAAFVFASYPFLDSGLTEEVFYTHSEYMAEYTFADGYPEGFAPQLINAGTLSILSDLILKKELKEGSAPVSASCIFDIIRTDINSFEVEACMAPKDYRMNRFVFSVEDKIDRMRCQNLYTLALDKKVPFKPVELTELAEKEVSVQKTVPAFYNIQIQDEFSTKAVYNLLSEKEKTASFMSLEKFKALVKEIKNFSDKAVISLSLMGDPLLAKDFPQYVKCILENENLSVLIETEGLAVTEDTVKNVAELAGENKDRIDWIVDIDAFTEAKYKEIHQDAPENAYALAVNSVSLLAKYFQGHVYPQMTRMNENEQELESFWRYWHDASSPSGGNIIIQKYDSFCKKLADRKSCDLSPVERIPCWHLRRDMCVLANGDVPLCRSRIYDAVLGNVFNEELSEIWKKADEQLKNHLQGSYCRECGDCDEFYTYNF